MLKLIAIIADSVGRAYYSTDQIFVALDKICDAPRFTIDLHPNTAIMKLSTIPDADVGETDTLIQNPKTIPLRRVVAASAAVSFLLGLMAATAVTLHLHPAPAQRALPAARPFRRAAVHPRIRVSRATRTSPPRPSPPHNPRPWERRQLPVCG